MTTHHVELIHLSDLHFGSGHRFSAPKTPDGAAAAERSFPTLADSLIQDLTDPENEPPRPTFMASSRDANDAWLIPPMPKLVCISGDFTVSASGEEFAQAEDFVNRFRMPPPNGLGLSAEAIFVCPGNHDLDWDRPDDPLRWRAYANFLNNIYPDKFEPSKASRFGGVKVNKQGGTLVLSLNSEIAVRNVSKDRTRGDLSQDQLAWVEEMLDQIDPEERHQYIKVAMVHHHPILIPALADEGHGYDAINNSQHLLTLLHRYGFHIILHGHKHHPHTFHEDVRSAFEQTRDHSLVVVAGGSCGSTNLLDKPTATQTYNRIRIHWSPSQGSIRVQVVTRGLVRHRLDGTELLAKSWKWKALATDDRYYLLGRSTQDLSRSSMRYTPPLTKNDPVHRPRSSEYERTRFNFPVAEVMPAMLVGQINEVHLRIVPHGSGSHWRRPEYDPVAVTWSAGPKFPTVRITREEDPDFRAAFAYYGGALVHCFSDSYSR